MPNLTAFISYIFLTSFTPGPNNIMAMGTSGKYGLAKSVPFCAGVMAGVAAISAVCLAFGAFLFAKMPHIETVMAFFGALYILWLAVSLYRGKKPENEGITEEAFSFWQGAVLQLVNPKVLLYAVTASSTFILPYYKSKLEVSAFMLLLAFMGFAGTFCWALFGSVFQKIFERRKREANLVMALLLVYCAVSLVAPYF